MGCRQLPKICRAEKVIGSKESVFNKISTSVLVSLNTHVMIMEGPEILEEKKDSSAIFCYILLMRNRFKKLYVCEYLLLENQYKRFT